MWLDYWGLPSVEVNVGLSSQNSKFVIKEQTGPELPSASFFPCVCFLHVLLAPAMVPSA
jgi:hypothetical protein